MSARDNGGPAFPVIRQESPNGDVYTFAADGMTLRDYFAAQIVAGTLLVAAKNDTNILTTSTEFEGDAIIASRAYKLADAMLRERAR